MSNDSTTAGYLTPIGDLPKYDEALEREISRWIRGVSGLAKEFVFPRWTSTQPQIPKNGINWCGFGITTIPQPLSQASVHVSDEKSEQWSWEKITVICSFYGPRGGETASNFRAGIFVEQNNIELNRVGMSLLDAGTIYNLPELINNQWVRRHDLTVNITRKNIRTYNIKSIIDGNITISTGD